MELGLSRGQACDYARISHECLKQWCREDEDFSADLTRYEAQGVVHHARHIHAVPNAQNSSAQVAASKFFLATRRKDGWSEKRAIEATGNLTVSLAQILNPDTSQDDEDAD